MSKNTTFSSYNLYNRNNKAISLINNNNNLAKLIQTKTNSISFNATLPADISKNLTDNSNNIGEYQTLLTNYDNINTILSNDLDLDINISDNITTISGEIQILLPILENNLNDISQNRTDILNNISLFNDFNLHFNNNINDLSYNSNSIEIFKIGILSNSNNIESNTVNINNNLLDISINKNDISLLSNNTFTDISNILIPLYPNIQNNFSTILDTSINIQRIQNDVCDNYNTIILNLNKLNGLNKKFVLATNTSQFIVENIISNPITFNNLVFQDTSIVNLNNIGLTGEFLLTQLGYYLITFECSIQQQQSAEDVNIFIYINDINQNNNIEDSLMHLFVDTITDYSNGTLSYLINNQNINNGYKLTYRQNVVDRTRILADSSRLIIEKL